MIHKPKLKPISIFPSQIRPKIAEKGKKEVENTYEVLRWKKEA